MQAAIEARAVTHRTGAGEVTVRDISLTVGPGELVAIIGGSGSGKTTLLDALSGLRPPTSGTVLRRAGGQVGYVPARDSLHPVLPLRTALRYSARLRGRGDPDEAVTEALAAAGLTAAAGTPVGALNPGERKRAEIAAELLAVPAELFLQEPTTALDAAQGTQVMRLLRRLSDAGAAVLLTTSNPLDAARCEKVAVLAAGGHLAFFGTPAAARGYFGADSLEEIYERLSGFGDPAVAWSRRFLYFSRTAAGAAPVPTLPRAPGPTLLIPDHAGPHSAGRPSIPVATDIDQGNWATPYPGRDPRLDLDRDYRRDSGGAGDPDREFRRELDVEARGDLAPGQGGEPDAPDAQGELGEDDALRAAAGASFPDPGQRAKPPAPLRPLSQLPILAGREAGILARSRRQQAIMAAAPLAAALLFCVLLVAGALNGPAAVTLAWALLAGLATGLAYELPLRESESGVLRRERFTTVSVPAFLTAKALLLVPALAVADLVILAVPAFADRLQAGFAPSYLFVLLASLVGLAATTGPRFLNNQAA